MVRPGLVGNRRDYSLGRSIECCRSLRNGSHRLLVSQFKARWPHFSGVLVRWCVFVRKSRWHVQWRGTSRNSGGPHVTCHVRTRMKQEQVPLSATVQLKMNETMESDRFRLKRATAPCPSRCTRSSRTVSGRLDRIFCRERTNRNETKNHTLTD